MSASVRGDVIREIDNYYLCKTEPVEGDRARMKILPIDPGKDIPVKKIYSILTEAKKNY
ncbi:MAG: hypothetical protein HKN25_01320 [Pyrinomonadaceae bacterium]|nr:hypothetical protein [Pyrinomonadaceae bacterium]